MGVLATVKITDYSADGDPPNPVLFEAGAWRLYGHIDDEYSTMAHKCPEWRKDSFSDLNGMSEWRWYWGKGECRNCHNTAPDDIQAVYTLHNFDRMAAMK